MSTQLPTATALAMRDLSPEEMRAVTGGENVLIYILKKIAEKVTDCTFDHWNQMVACFKSGREAAKG